MSHKLPPRPSVVDGAPLRVGERLEEAMMRQDFVPVVIASTKMYMASDRLFRLGTPSPLLGRSVFKPQLTEEEEDSLTPEELLRVLLWSGDPVVVRRKARNRYKTGEVKSLKRDDVLSPFVPPTLNPNDGTKAKRKIFADYRLIATSFLLRTEEGTTHRAYLLWVAPSQMQSQAFIRTPNWYRMTQRTRATLSAQNNGQLSGTTVRFAKELSFPDLQRLYPVLLTRPINEHTELFSVTPARYNEEQEMLNFIRTVGPTPALQLEDRVYYTDGRTLLRDSVRVPQEPLTYDDQPLIDKQGAVALLVSEPLEQVQEKYRILTAEPSELSESQREEQRKLLADAPKMGEIVGQTVPLAFMQNAIERARNPRKHVPTSRSGATLKFMPNSMIISCLESPHHVQVLDRTPLNWEHLTEPNEELRVPESEIEPPLGITWENENFSILLARGQTLAEVCIRFDRRKYEPRHTHIVKVFPDGRKLVVFTNHQDLDEQLAYQLVWPISPRPSALDLLRVLTGKP